MNAEGEYEVVSADQGRTKLGVGFVGACILPVLLLAPFLNKAVHIDDPLFIWTAQQVLETPLNPYGFVQNWYLSPQPMHEINQNPPLLGYYFAVVGGIFGWEEWKLHLAMLPWAMVASACVFLLARRFHLPALAASILWCIAPGVWVSSTTLMTDIPMVALWLLAMVVWLEGLDRSCNKWLACAGVLMALAIFMKYFAISLIPLLLVYTLAREQRIPKQIVWLGLPLVLLLGYELWTRYLYGVGHFFDAIFYAQSYEASIPVSKVEKTVTGLIFIGLSFVPITLWLAWAGEWGIKGGKVLGWILASVAGAAILLWGGLYTQGLHALPVQALLHGAVGFGTSLVALGVIAVSLLRWRDPFALLMLCWLGGAFVFAAYLNHYVNVRVLLPLAPALILVALRMTDGRLPQAAFAGVCALGLGMGAVVTHGDYKLANAQRDAVEEIGWLDLTEPLNFSGHWGFQYYMEQMGGEILNLNEVAIVPGQTVIVPENNTNVVSIRAELTEHTASMTVPVNAWASVMQPRLGAGFYSDVWGPLPYVLGPAMPERYGIAILRELPGAWDVRRE